MKRKNGKSISCRDWADISLSAVRQLAEPVKATLGPDGLPILLEQIGKPPLITKDGVTVSNSIYVDDPVFNTIIQAVKEASARTGELVGDGTTTAVVLTEALIEKGFQFIKAGLITPQALVREIKELIPGVIEYLQSIGRPINNEDEIRRVASISSNSDVEIAEKVTEAMARCGKDGLFELVQGSGPGIEVIQKEGYQVGKGWSRHKDYAPLMITDPLSQAIVFSNNPSILLYNGEINDPSEFGEFILAFNQVDTALNQAYNMSQIVVVAHQFSGQIRQMVADNWQQHGLPIMLVETEQMGPPMTRIYLLDDLAAYTGGQVIQQGHLKEVIERVMPTRNKIKDGTLGKCESVRQMKAHTTFDGGQGNQEGILNHVQVIRKQMEIADARWDANIHRMRMARLTNGLVVIEVGGMTELEMKERRDRVDDAVQATRAAMKEGIVPGGGVALLRCSEQLPVLMPGSYGVKVLEHMLQAPIRQIIKNGGESPDKILTKIPVVPSFGGYDALNGKIVESMFEAGIIDPFLVVKTSFEHAISIGCEILRGGGYVVYNQEVKPEAPAMAYGEGEENE